MEPIKMHKGIVAPLDRANVDTDAIIPKQFLKKIERTGFGKHLFHELRYTDYEGTRENENFILNDPAYRKASILVAQENFGCGSSREHAPWALSDFGFRVIIAPSFADIFYNNCVKNGILLVKLKSDEVSEVMTQANKPGTEISVDLERQIVEASPEKKYSFEINSFAKHCLLNGLDQIGWTMQFEDKISGFENKIKEERPWLA